MSRRRPELPVRLSADPPDTTHAIRLHSGEVVGWAIALLVFACFWLFMGVFAVASPSSFGDHPPNPKGAPTALGEVAMLTAGVALAWLAIRMTRIGVKARAGELTIYNMWRTHVINAGDIRAINLEPNATSDGPGLWMPRIHLADESSVWLEYFSCGPANKPPTRKLAAKVDKVRVRLGAAGDVLPVLPESL